MKNVYWLTGCCLVLAACAKYIFREHTDREIEGSEKEFTIKGPSKSDILFVIDNSGSMSEEIDNVRDNIVSFVSALSATGNQFRIAVTTTDNRDGTATSCADTTGLPPGADPVHNGRCGRFLAPTGRAKAFIDRADFNSPTEMANAFGTFLNRGVTINTDTATGGSAVEQPIKSAFAALNPDLRRDGAPNEKFFREDALALIILVTDESDCSFDDANQDVFRTSPANLPNGYTCYSRQSELKTAAAWAEDIAARKGNRSNVRVGLISASVRKDGSIAPSGCRLDKTGARAVPSDQCACFYDNSTQYCQFTPLMTPTVTNGSGNNQLCGNKPNEGNCCTAMANDRLFQFANEFTNLKDSICQDSFGETLQRLAALADLQCFTLDRPPLDGKEENVIVEMRRAGTEDFVPVPLSAIKNDATGDGWFLDSNGAACLAGTWKRKGEDTVSVFVVSGDTNPNAVP
jgi:hypothetical protein